MRVLLLVTLVVATVALPTPSEILGSSNCIYVDSSDTIDCSSVSSVDEIITAMGQLSISGHTDFTGFKLTVNEHLTHLPQGMLGDIHFKFIAITDNPFLTSVGDILGASKSTVIQLDLSRNKLAHLPRIESSSLITFKMNGQYLASITSNALNAVPKLQTIELQEAGIASDGLLIGEGTFLHLPHLQELNMKDYIPKDNKATKGSFTFNSDSLHTVNLVTRGPRLQNVEVGTFGGFNSNTNLILFGPHPITIESFYPIFSNGSHVSTQELQPCNLCNLDWLKFSRFIQQTSINCVYGRGYYNHLADIEDHYFADCTFGKTI